MLLQLPVLNSQLPPAIIIKQEAPKKPEPEQVTVEDGMTLTSIAESHGETAQRLFDKNLNISSPDVIIPGQKLNIPLRDEKLDDRPFPDTIEVSANAGGSKKPEKPSISGGFSVSGNSYTAGNCTWYAKNQRPDLPNDLGNADTWYLRAAAEGFKVGSTPRVGAVAAAIGYTHVAIVTAVNGGTVTVAEMNYVGLGRISTRAAPASEFHYIY